MGSLTTHVHVVKLTVPSHPWFAGSSVCVLRASSIALTLNLEFNFIEACALILGCATDHQDLDLARALRICATNMT
jgi:hypothetical protein